MKKLGNTLEIKVYDCIKVSDSYKERKRYPLPKSFFVPKVVIPDFRVTFWPFSPRAPNTILGFEIKGRYFKIAY